MAPPSRRNIASTFLRYEHVQPLTESVQLRQGETRAGPARPSDQLHLQEELQPQISNVLDRLGQPHQQTATAGCRDSVHRPPWARIARFGSDRLCQPCRDQSIERPVDQRPAHGEDPAQLAVRPEMTCNGERVSRTLGEPTEDRPLVERKCRAWPCMRHQR